MFKNFKNIILVKIFEVFSKYIKKKNFTKLQYSNKNISLLNISSITKFRSDSFFLKEPETLNYINSFGNNDIFWDIGANVGLYSLFAAKIKNCKVYSFEPSVFNLEILARNINQNKLQKKIKIIPLSLGDKNIEGFFHIPLDSYGSALSSFKNKKDKKDIFSYQTISLNADFLINNKIIEKPNYIKLDVDGNEMEILKGMKKNISKVKSVILEMDYGNPSKIKMIQNYFKMNNFSLKSKDQSQMIKESLYRKVFNEVWCNKKFNF